LAERIPDLLPVLALIAAAMARVVPSSTLSSHVDVLLALLVLATALDIDPRQLLRVGARWRTILLLVVVPALALAGGGWLIAQLGHGETRNGVLALGFAPAEVASVGLIGLMGGAAELAVGVLALSLVLSALAGPPALAALGHASHGAHVLPLLGRFGLIVLLPLVIGLLLRGARPELAKREHELSVSSSIIVILLIFASLSDTHSGDLAGPTALSAAFLAFSGLLAALSLRTFGRRFEPTLALTIGMRDFAVAAALAQGAYGARAAQVAGIYGTMMLIAGATVTAVVRRIQRREPEPLI
jgi:predicted Na+-dependent transporter